MSHLYKTWALADSLFTLQHNCAVHILVIDGDKKSVVVPGNFNRIYLYTLEELPLPIAKKIIKKYAGSKDKLRWSLKPAFIQELLSNGICNKVVYTDNDIAFFNDFTFLFEELDTHSVLLTPHRYPVDPEKNQNWLEANFKVGLYNAGFIGVNKNAVNLMEWWSKCCYYRCEKNAFRGLFDDQKYLDLVPVIQPSTKVLNHKGCNIAEWNIQDSNRTIVESKILIDKSWPIVFIHFNKTTIQSFINGNDMILKPYFDQYVVNLKKYNPQLNISDEGYTMGLIENIKLNIWKVLNKLNRS